MRTTVRENARLREGAEASLRFRGAGVEEGGKKWVANRGAGNFRGGVLKNKRSHKQEPPGPIDLPEAEGEERWKAGKPEGRRRLCPHQKRFPLVRIESGRLKGEAAVGMRK